MTASRVFGVRARGGDRRRMRAKIKAMNYGLAYGLSAYGLAQQLRIEPAEARGLMDEYFETLRRGARLPRRHRRRGPAHRVHRDHHGPAPLPARPDQRQPAAPRDGRADGAQRPDPGVGRRPDQGGDAARSTRRSATQGLALTDAAAGARRARASRSRRASARRSRRWCAREMGGAADLAVPAGRVGGHRPQLARRGSLTVVAGRQRLGGIRCRGRGPAHHDQADHQQERHEHAVDREDDRHQLAHGADAGPGDHQDDQCRPDQRRPTAARDGPGPSRPAAAGWPGSCPARRRSTASRRSRRTARLRRTSAPAAAAGRRRPWRPGPVPPRGSGCGSGRSAGPPRTPGPGTPRRRRTAAGTARPWS